MGPRAGLGGCGKSRPPQGFDPPTVQPVASRYTDYATRPTSDDLAGHYIGPVLTYPGPRYPTSENGSPDSISGQFM